VYRLTSLRNSWYVSWSEPYVDGVLGDPGHRVELDALGHRVVENVPREDGDEGRQVDQLLRVQVDEFEKLVVRLLVLAVHFDDGVLGDPGHRVELDALGHRVVENVPREDGPRWRQCL
jgi:hypothetical protein